MPSKSKLRAVLRRLAKDDRGNTLIITAAAIIPMMAMIGGGLDVARAHFAKSRLGQACDAAALAGRRAMSNEDISTATAEATKFFDYNFPQEFMQTAAFTPQITRPSTGTVQVSASTTVPTTIMKIFDYDNIPISVECDATQNFDNIDIVLVLDVTGSMDDTISGEKKIVSLRSAVMALYDKLASAQTELAAQGLRVRYGIVPYSSTVNVGHLVRAVNADYIASSWNYHSRFRDDDEWKYGFRNFDTSSFKTGGSVDLSTLGIGATGSVTWNGCIEERTTTNSITESSSYAYNDIPTNARDLQIDLIPSDANSRWGPQFRHVVFHRNGNWMNHADRNWCPAQARRLAVMDRATMQTYVNGLTPVGPTYHDIGMIWGARFVSRNGIFAGDNPSEYGETVVRPVNRFVIYLTDGQMDPSAEANAAYGIERYGQKVRGLKYNNSMNDGTTSILAQRHTTRFLMACNAAKQGGAQIWAIAFGLTAPTSLQTCAGSVDRVKTSANKDQLVAQFEEIGKNIGALRLSQ